MNIFLTGYPKIGKSTIIQKVLAELAIKPSGFVTLAGMRNPEIGSDVYIHSTLSNNTSQTPNNLVGHRVDDGIHYESNPITFDTVGVEILKNATPPLVLMDELGFMENKALIFQQEVIRILNSNIPVLGVIKPKDTPFLNQVRSHPQTKLIEVTEANRDELALDLTKLLQKILDL